MNTDLLVTVEILLVVVAPLLVLYLKAQWPLRATVPCLLTIPVLWYFTYAPLHELSHVAGAYAVGGTVTSIKLIPRFWVGEFGRAWITTEGLRESWQQLIMTSFPYVLDVACIVAGYVLLRRSFSRSPFVVGFTFMLLCLRPAFDLVCETVAFMSGDRGDLYHIERAIGGVGTWSMLGLAIGVSAIAIASVLRRFVEAPADPS